MMKLDDNFSYNFCLCSAKLHKNFTNAISSSVKTYTNALVTHNITVSQCVEKSIKRIKNSVNPQLNLDISQTLNKFNKEDNDVKMSVINGIEKEGK